MLFLCVGNSCRSQMAEGFAKEYGRGIIEAGSAGTAPASRISPTAIAVMQEKGIDISSQQPRRFNPAEVHNFDVLISMGCGVSETCPALFLKDFTDWGLEDPIGQPIEKYREVRDIIEVLVRDLILKYSE